MGHARITVLILAQLGIAGCASQPPVVEAEVIPIGSVAPPASGEPYVIANEPGPLGSALAPTSSATPPPSAVATARSRTPVLRPTASGFGGRPPVFPRPPPPRTRTVPVPGRPLVVDGVAHVASFSSDAAMTVTSDDIEALVSAARDEHASIAAFARTIAELMALGAPLSLVHETQAALGDEIRHTTMTLALLERLTGEPRSLGALPAATLPLQREVNDFFRDVLRGGAVGETLAAADADARAERASEPELRAYYAAIANDEARHAALAFKTLRWLLAAQPFLAAALSEERAQLSSEERTLTAPLFAAIAA